MIANELRQTPCLARPRHVPQHLLHVDVLIPELVDPGEQRHGAVPHVARVVHKLVLHLHLGVLEPQGQAAVVHLQSTLPDRPANSMFKGV